MSPRFVPMTAADLDEVLAIEAQSFEDPWTADQFAAELGGDHSQAELLRDPHGALLGFAIYRSAADEVEIHHLAVAREHRWRGVGSELVERIVAWASERSCRAIFLEVRRSNQAAIALYERHAFRPVTVRKGYYASDGEDAIVMHRSL